MYYKIISNLISPRFLRQYLIFVLRKQVGR
nr:MAG TPA: hypothetical protein [Caudoviricetes sp.]